MRLKIIAVCLIAIFAFFPASAWDYGRWDYGRSDLNVTVANQILDSILYYAGYHLYDQIDYMEIHKNEYQINRNKTYQRIVTITITIIDPEKEYIGHLNSSYT